MGIIKWIKKETIQVFPAVIYFLICFNLIYFTVGLTLESGARYFTPLHVSLAALIVGKVLIIANNLPFINMFPKKPLIYNIIWKYFIYVALTFLLWLAETALELHFKHDDLSMLARGIQLRITSPIFLSALSWLSATFLIFVIANEYILTIGKKKIMEMLLTKR